MSYAEHGPRIFLTGRPSSGVPLTYGDYVLPQKRSEGRLKLYNSCTDIRAWSPNVSESTRYFRELNEHEKPAVLKLIPSNVIMENMMTLTAQAQRELRVARRELQKYRSLRLTPEQREHLKNFDRAIGKIDIVGTDKTEDIRTESIIRPLSQGHILFNANKIASLQCSDTYLSIYFRPDRFQYGASGYPLLTNTRVLRQNLSGNPLLENNTYLMSRVTSCNILTEVKATREHNEQASICIEYVDASSQAAQDVREMGVQTEECKENDDKQSNIDSPSSQYYETTESVSTFESELGMNSDPEICEKNHKGVIIQKDSEIIVLKNELGMKEDELEELRDLNRHMQTLLKEEDKNTSILRRNVNVNRKNLKVLSDRRDDEIKDLSAKLSSFECLVDQLKAELARKCQVCYFQTQEIQKLRKEVKETELLCMENESLTRKVKEMEHLSREAESCGIALEQMKNVWRERDMLQKQYREQSCTLADREDEIKRLLTLIKQMSVTADTREVEMNGVVADLRNEIQAKNDKISQCEMQLVCMEREVGNLTNMLKSSLNNFDESKIAYEGICDYTKCEHDTCLDVQSALSALKSFIAELEECKLERRNRLREIDNLKAYVTCYSQETVSEITNTDFDTGHELIQPTAEDVSTSSNGGCQSSKELVNVQIQSDDVDTTTTCSEESEKIELNEVISYRDTVVSPDKDIDRALAMHIKRSIDKMHKISAILQGAGDHHVQIIKEYTRQQQELQKKDLEITELKQKVAEHILRRGEGDCAIKEKLRKKMLKKEKVLEAIISKRNSKIERLHGHLTTLENDNFSYRAECDALKVENAHLIDAKNLHLKKNNALNEELKAQRDHICELTLQIDELRQTIDVLKEETNNVECMKEKLIDLELKNNDLTNKLIEANETISKNAEVITELECKDEKNKVALTHERIKYDAMLTQKHSDIVELQDENQSLHNLLRDAEVKLAQSNDAILSLRQESDNVAAINVLQASLSDLDVDKERLLVKVDYLKGEIANYRSCTASVESKLHVLSHGNEVLQADIETVRSTNDQLFYPHENAVKSLKDALYTIPKKLCETLLRLRTEVREYDNEIENASEYYSNKKFPEIKDEIGKQQKIYADKSCQQDEDTLVAVVQEVDCNSENAAHKLRFFEGQYEEKLKEIEKLTDDVKLRDREIKSLQEYITHLLQEKNDLQTKVKVVEEYQNKLTLLKEKYDSSLIAFHKRHNENVERLQTRFEDIMKIEKSPFDAESWLQSLGLKELSELHNRINILSSHAAESTESNTAQVEIKQDYDNCRNNSQEHKFYNKFTLCTQYTKEDRSILSKKASKEEFRSKVLDAENNETVAITKLYSRDLRQEYK
ncbi:hypothetical protein ALC62_06480 [Cyphomyrmex costatus]|uniref:Uncharacterized protein n=1 Tax=Cyphomyrmex costatus TaxID=456900 RepID=A0A195CPX4_9HYME|nr:hypothetical protein ALC62_06480 [Cyphomyrmex costatus]